MSLDSDAVDTLDRWAVAYDGPSICIAGSENDLAWFRDAGSLSGRHTLHPPTHPPQMRCYARKLNVTGTAWRHMSDQSEDPSFPS